ncbi:ribonuclease HII [Candidatus Woesearchaeota archaeon]|jgi:ribonuclease HII|nr:ribonuclease HII [Candidatus Woesearchaeota archaeon]MBT6045013.1 ribonuclease HII [Candidatus Woesearchaeota archaeon]
MKVCGIDEAGRGPLIGPLVMAGVMVEEENRKLLKDLEVKDSKLLTRKRREDLFDKIKAISDYFILIVEPGEIDAALNNPDLNLNKLEGLKIADIINNLNPDKVIIDAPSNNIEAFKEFLFQFIENKEVEMILEHKADENYEVCSAASILAKVTRDREIENLHDKHGDCGSGYPSDPKTKEFLKENWEKCPEIFRRTWATYEKVANTKKQKSLSEY